MEVENSSTSKTDILSKKRQLTNKKTIFVFIAFVVFWIGIAVHAFSAGDAQEVTSKYKNEILNLPSIFIIMGYVLLSGLYSMIFFLFISWFSDVTYLILTVFWVPLAASLVAVFHLANFATVVAVISSLFSCVMTLLVIHQEWFHLPEQMLKEACRLIVFFPACILVASICCYVSVTLTVFGSTTHLLLSTIKNVDSESSPGYIIFFQLMNLLVSHWIVLFSLYFGATILSGAFATWYWTPNKAEIPGYALLRSIKIISRYHLGTIAFAAAIPGTGKTHHLMIKHLIKTIREGNVNKRYICFAIYNIFDALVTRFIIACSLVICAIDGFSYYKSAKISFDYFLRYPRKCMLMAKIFENVLLGIITVLALFMLLSILVYEVSLNVALIASIALGSTVFVLPMLLVLTAAYNTIMLCFVEDLDKNDGSERKPYAMSAELKRAFDLDGPPTWYDKRMPDLRLISNVNVYKVSANDVKY